MSDKQDSTFFISSYMFILCEVTQHNVIDLFQTNVSLFYNNFISYKMKILEANKSVLERSKKNRVNKWHLNKKRDERNEEDVYSAGAFE